MSRSKSCVHWVLGATLAVGFTAVGGCKEDVGKQVQADLDGGPTADASVDSGGPGTDGGDGGHDGADGAAPNPDVRWYDSREPLDLTLSGAFGTAFGAAFAGTPDGIVPPDRKKDPFAGSIAYAYPDGTKHPVQVSLAVRGNSSLQECAFPKLKFAFEKRIDAADDVFVATREVKIGTHCGEETTVNGTIGRLRNQDAAFREEVVYQLARALGITTLQTRPAIIHYTDTSAEPVFDSPLSRRAFLLEHVDELAHRLGAEALKDPVDCGDKPDARPDHEAVLRVKFFHAMVGNWDWALGPPETDGCGSLMNTEVLVHPDGSLTLVPADFDLAAFVVGRVRDSKGSQLTDITLEAAKVSARNYLTQSLVGESDVAIAAMKAEYLQKQPLLEQLVHDSLMDADGKQGGQHLLDGFFAVLAE